MPFIHLTPQQFRLLLIAALFHLTALFSVIHAEQRVFVEQQAVFYPDSSTHEFALDTPYRVHLPSLHVRVNGIPLIIDSSFTVRQPPPVIILTTVPPNGSRVEIRYVVVPVSLASGYRSNSLSADSVAASDTTWAVAGGVPLRRRPPVRTAQDDMDDEFEKTGSLTRGLTVGSNRGVRLNSGLRLQLRGMVQEDLEVTASLTDENSPLQPEGNTKTLSEIDKIFFQVRGKHFETTLGDYALDLEGTRFAGYHRQLEGVTGRGVIGSRSALFSAASTQGEFHINKFFGQEGNQGPYQLTGRNGERNIIVVGGTEKVFIDGRPMVRGENNDFVIEYASGEITFTRRRLITSDSRIEVEFQYFTGQFKKTFLSFRTEGDGISPQMQYRFTFLRESDGEGDPLSFALMEDAPGYWSGSDDGGFADPALFYVGEARGAYVRVDTLSQMIYRYTGPGRGAYEPTFTAVGAGRGDYELTEDGWFNFTGKGTGAYLPVNAPAVKRRQDLADLELRFTQSDWLQLTGEMAMSRLGEETSLEGLQSGHNGSAVHFAGVLSPAQWKIGNVPLGKTRLSAKYARQGADFEELGRIREVEYSRKWDIRDQDSRGEETLELEGRYEPASRVSVTGGYGRLNTGPSVHSDRRHLQVQVALQDSAGLLYKEERIGSSRSSGGYNGDWLRQWLEAGRTVGIVHPSVEFERERKTEQYDTIPDDGFSFYRMLGRLRYEQYQWLHMETSMERRQDDTFAGGSFEKEALSHTQQYAVTLRPGGGLTSSGSFIRRIKHYAGGAQDAVTTLADVMASYRPGRRFLNTSVNAQVSQERVPRREEIYFDVGEGRGDYRYDELRNEYVPDPFGSFIRRTFSTTSFQAVRGVKIGGSFDFSARRLFDRRDGGNDWTGLILGIGSKTILRYESKQQIDNADDEGGAALPGGDYLNRRYVRQDLTFLEHIPDTELRLRLTIDNRLSHEIVDRAEKRLSQEQSIRLRTRLSRMFGIQIEAGRNAVIRTFATQAQSSRDILADRYQAEFFLTPRTSVEYALRVQHSREQDRAVEHATKVRVIGVKPSIRYAMTNRGRLTGEAGWFRVKVNNDLRILPYELAEGRYPGQTVEWRVNFQYRMSSHLMTNVEYAGNLQERRTTGPAARAVLFQEARAELRAFF